jgi:hypothetical protein
MTTGAAPADTWDRWAETVSERLNPIIVKEVRQGLRTRSFWVFFSLQLFICLIIALIAFAVTGDSVGSEGVGFFIAFFLCLAVVQFFVLPYSAYRSMAREREEETWVLLTLTGIGPRRVLRGKLGSYAVQGLLYASAAGPFVLFSYYLNGIDLPTVVVALALGFAWHLFLISLAVSMATLAESRIVRGLLHFVLIFGLLQGLIMGLTSAFGLVEATRRSSSGEVWVALVAVCFVMVSTAVLMFEAAAARLSLVTENYSRGPRLAFLGQFLGGLLLFTWGWLADGRDHDIAVGGSVTASVYLMVVGMLVATDLDGMSRAHAPRAADTATGAVPRSLFKPGALRGFRLVIVCLVASTALFSFLLVNSGTSADEKDLRVILGAPLYAAMIISAALLLPRLTQQPAVLMPALSRIVAVVLFAMLSGLPALIASLSGMEPDDALLNVLNPVVGLVNLGRGSTSGWEQVVVVAGASGLLVLLAHWALERRDLLWGAR